MKKITFLLLIILFTTPSNAMAHRSGCHRWHSCPSDTGSYVCGDLGYPCQYPTYSSGGVTYPADGIFRTQYQGAVHRIAKYGMKNDLVKNIQLKLVQKGYLSIENASGYFGIKTETAVKKFQTDQKFNVDGIVGDTTLKALGL